MALTEFAAKKSKPKEKSYKLADSGGLHLLIQPNGSKLWRLKYRFGGKEKLLSFGPYPLITIAKARKKRDDAKKLLLDGVDPGYRKKLDRIAQRKEAAQTFALLAEEYLARKKDQGAAKATLKKTEWLLLDLAKPLHDRPMREIHPAEILELLQRIEKSGRRETARRLRGTIGSVFKHAIATLRADSDPTLALHGALLAPKVTRRAAILDEKELGLFLKNLDEYDGWPTIRAGILFQILTCARPGEVRGAVRSEFDLDNAVWKVPAGRMKMRRPHDVPLSKQALKVLEEIWFLSEDGSYVFPSIRSPDRPLSNNAFNAAMRRMGYAKEQVTAHGFRATASSILNERGHDPDVIEAALAHQDTNAIRRAYNRASYWIQRQKLLQNWADLLDSLRG